MRKILRYMFEWLFRSLAKIALYRHQPTIVAITGNVGKTTTKDVIVSVLGTSRKVAATIRSQNTDLTTPMSILGLEVQSRERNIAVWLGLLARGARQALLSDTFPEILVLEVGAGEPGDIARQAQWLRPHISVFTALQKHPVHIDYFSDRQELFNEKKQLARYTRPGGTIVYNSDDEFLPNLLRECPQHKIAVGSRGDVVVEGVRNTYAGVESCMTARGVAHPVRLGGVWGESYMYSYALAIGVAMDLGLDLSDCMEEGGTRFNPAPGRMRLLKGKDGSLVVDDAYNASPKAVESLLQTLNTVEMPGRKIFLFGDMKELGEYSRKAHESIGTLASSIVDMIVLVGTEVSYTKQAMIDEGFRRDMIFELDDTQSAGAFVASMIHSGDIIVAKSSRHAIRMERALVQLVETEERDKLVQEYL